MMTLKGTLPAPKGVLVIKSQQGQGQRQCCWVREAINQTERHPHPTLSQNMPSGLGFKSHCKLVYMSVNRSLGVHKFGIAGRKNLYGDFKKIVTGSARLEQSIPHAETVCT